jgi:hypothetical protein
MSDDRTIPPFWEKVAQCQHEWSPNYSGLHGCTCGRARESHCLRCGVYETEDPCGELAGSSGWSQRRWSAGRRPDDWRVK